VSQFNLQRRHISVVAHALGELNERVVYVGGAAAGLYVSGSLDEDVRSTLDIDLTVEIASMYDLENLRQTLEMKGFKQSMHDDVMCRFRLGDLLVDVMSTIEMGWAPTNRWFAQGFSQRRWVELEDLGVYVLPIPYYVASKFDAYLSRGDNSPRTSHDFEDIVWLFDQVPEGLSEFEHAPAELTDFLAPFFELMCTDAQWREAVLVHLPYTTRNERFDTMISKLKRLY
jgi:predicted nucleotidyltransferase